MPPPKKIEWTRRPRRRQRALEIGDQRIHVGGVGQRLAQLVRIEVAVRALPHAPRDVDVERERGQRREAQLGPDGGERGS